MSVSNQRFMPLPRILHYIWALNREGKTGSLFMKTRNKHLICFVLKDGVITTVRYGSQGGESCFAKIAAVREAMCHFKENDQVLYKQMFLPDTRTILEDIQVQHQHLYPAANKSVASVTLTQETLDSIERLLLDHLGPIADIYIDKLAEHNNLEAVLLMLREDVGDDDLLDRIRELV